MNLSKKAAFKVSVELHEHAGNQYFLLFPQRFSSNNLSINLKDDT